MTKRCDTFGESEQDAGRRSQLGRDTAQPPTRALLYMHTQYVHGTDETVKKLYGLMIEAERD